MTGRQDADRIAERFETLILPVLEKNKYGLIKTEYVSESGNWFLRAYIVRDDGADIGINDCALVSRIVSKKLDKDDFIDDEYTLEICSKGFMEEPQTEPDEDAEDNEPV
ncbi:MAG: ribosome assembly cofactor RimP [Lachnospiraceae bacterium]|nr:ribosome assembly cofactor RimP [Lachnospiraceae bacterium]